MISNYFDYIKNKPLHLIRLFSFSEVSSSGWPQTARLLPRIEEINILY